MEKKNTGLVVLVIILSLLVVGLGGYIVYDKLLGDKDIDNKNNMAEVKNDYVTDNDNDDEIKLDIISIDDVSIDMDRPNEKLWIEGKMTLNFDESKYFPVFLSGYCLGSDDEKYFIHGPGSGTVSFNNGDNIFRLVNSINDENGDVVYKDGTTKKNVDFSNVKIKYCKIDKLTAYKINDGNESDSNISVTIELNYEKTIND